MATFRPNPNSNGTDPWIEWAVYEDSPFRIWHIMFFCFSGFSVLVILICCCTKFRIPRTKQEIEADFRRKKLTEKFRERLRLIQNMDEDIDLKKALEIIQEDYCNENKNIDDKMGIDMYPAADSNLASIGINKNCEKSRAEPQQPTSKGFIFHKIANTFTRSTGLTNYN